MNLFMNIFSISHALVPRRPLYTETHTKSVLVDSPPPAANSRL